jgi:hypothetical protein
MSALVIELTPSTSGWYFASAAAWRGRLSEHRLLPTRPPEEEEVAACPGALGYGADGRPRPTPSRSRVSFLA